MNQILKVRTIGLSLALGALLAGLILSESEYSSQALGNILPFRDVFTSFFFISIGMLLLNRCTWDHILADTAQLLGLYKE
jgi:CPA2 family monovalent cation:H+ antiporter-2